MSNDAATPTPVYRPVFGIADSLAAIDEVIASAQRVIKVFDVSLSNRGFNTPARAEMLRQFLVAGRAHRLLVALHETELLERENARLLALLRQFPMSIEIHRTVAQARTASDPFVVADDHSVWHQLHFDQPRAMWRCIRPPTRCRSRSASTRSGSSPSRRCRRRAWASDRTAVFRYNRALARPGSFDAAGRGATAQHKTSRGFTQ